MPAVSRVQRGGRTEEVFCSLCAANGTHQTVRELFTSEGRAAVDASVEEDPETAADVFRLRRAATPAQARLLSILQGMEKLAAKSGDD